MRKKTPSNNGSNKHKSISGEPIPGENSDSTTNDFGYGFIAGAFYALRYRMKDFKEQLDKIKKDIGVLAETQLEIREILLDIQDLLECIEIVEV